MSRRDCWYVVGPLMGCHAYKGRCWINRHHEWDWLLMIFFAFHNGKCSVELLQEQDSTHFMGQGQF